jgi:PadR family transcriptional regulator, regulatory protein PadR
MGIATTLQIHALPAIMLCMELGETRNPLSQLRRGVLEYCVLSLLGDEELYGFDLVRRLGDVNGMVTSEGTIYPLLSRLRRDGWVTTTWVESETGPPRRYYAITPAGAHALKAFTHEWRRFRDAVDQLLGGDREHPDR